MKKRMSARSCLSIVALVLSTALVPSESRADGEIPGPYVKLFPNPAAQYSYGQVITFEQGNKPFHAMYIGRFDGYDYFQMMDLRVTSGHTKGVDKSSVNMTRSQRGMSVPQRKPPAPKSAVNNDHQQAPEGRGESPVESQHESQFKGMGDRLEGAMATSLAEALFKGLIWSARDQRDLEIALDQINRTRAKNEHINRRIEGMASEASDLFKTSYEQMAFELERMSREGGIPIPADDYQIVTQAPDLRQKVAETRRILKSIYTLELHRQNARDAGLAMSEEADQAYAQGDLDGGDIAISYAKTFADIAIGWDPYTGLARDLWELSNGVNPFTGESLDDADYAKAAIGVFVGSLAFGVPQKVARGIRVLNKIVKNSERARAAEAGVRKFFQVFRRSEGIVNAASGIENAAMHSSFLHTRYMKNMMKMADKPWVSDAKLGSMFNDLWRQNAKVGNGSTMAAIINERITGLPTKGKFHFDKGEKYLKGIENWLSSHPAASTHDRHMAEKVMQYLRDALFGNLDDVAVNFQMNFFKQMMEVA